MLKHPTTILVGILTVSVIINLIRERRKHDRNLDSIPLRILVNGSRGKSSTTRLIRAALAAADPDGTAAKTTGSAARFIAPSGRETPIVRKNKIVNVIEQLHVVERAVVFDVHTIVMECMAVDPDLQQLNTEVLVKPQITVITNAREDHLDEMGGPDRDVAGVARSLCRSIPTGGICVTAETDPDILTIIRQEAEMRGARLVWADATTVTDAEMRHFPWICFPDNVAIALAVADLQGVPRQQALAGMYQANPDPGVLRVDPVTAHGKRFKAANLFAANDPQSTLQNIALLRKLGLVSGGISMVINCRPDRVERNGQMGAICSPADPEWIFLIGEPVKSAADQIAPHLRDRIVALEGEQFSGEDVLESIAHHITDDPEHALVLVGNIHMAGEDILEALHGATAAGLDLDTELRQLTDQPDRRIPVDGLDQTLVWRDEGLATIIPEIPDHVARQRTQELRTITPRHRAPDDDVTEAPDDDVTEQIDLRELRNGPARTLFLREPADTGRRD